MEVIDDFQQLKVRFVDPIQHDYEVIRPIVLFAETVKARSESTQVERTTLGDKARKFVKEGMLGLVDGRQSAAGRKGHEFPDPVARHILYLKQIYPPMRNGEIARILQRNFGYETNHHTIQAFLDRYPIPVQLQFDLKVYHDFEDAYEARWTVVKYFYQGWHARSIAGLMKLSYAHVRRIVRAFEKDGFAGLEDSRSRPAAHPENQLTMPFLQETLEIQKEYPRAGRFRIQGIMARKRAEAGDARPVPSERTIGRALSLTRVFFKAPGFVPAPDGPEPEDDPRPLPFNPTYLHEYWYIDVRYLVQLDGHWVYSICIIEGCSRSILAGMASEYQDELAVLQLVHAALAEYGCPGAIVSDNGGSFKGAAYTGVLDGLNVDHPRIEKRKPWQNLIEAQFKIQLRLADAKFEEAKTLEEIQARHAEFIHTFNTTAHWAHRQREDGLRTPEAVLGGALGRSVESGELDKRFRGLQFERTVNRHGCVSIQRFYVYAEHGMAKKRVSVWMHAGWLRVEYEQIVLARYAYTHHRRRRALKTISRPKIYQTAFASPQIELFELDETQWLKIWQRPESCRRRRHDLPPGIQLTFLAIEQTPVVASSIEAVPAQQASQ